ncbi:SUMF1/EgtB/PvdO family nonheme iron enzyme [Caldichromatium japonicum]|uniref:SUMF1/EgtB/PvdO family nonheme iron enzyme n=1 Tax=Caldichromatium japonicum TaxID=2699430 RepID=A0A6G7VBF5_9GAMM|nr:SUMF1/EgtB/PvdO family nonheme iron enzyme [Caldichromatium japonicum]QIK37240.1 SUMF1/EgtB/PvdO family nonheme iron enzyme [Caldichromatium japonicum]
MAEQSDPQFSSDAESELLRKTLEQLRQEAEAEIKHLRALLSEEAPLTSNQIATATEQLALEQEIAVMQKALEAKEQALDQITAECRRLEDVLEDQRLTFERLRKELGEKEEMLKAARAEIDRLKSALVSAQSSEKPASPSSASTVIYETRIPLWLRATSGALVLLLALSGAANIYLLRSAPATEGEPSSAPPIPGPPPLPKEPPLVASETTPETMRPTSAGQRPRIHIDRLADGTPGPTLIVLDGGAFQMGAVSPTGEDFSPPRMVTVRPFMIGAHEVTFIEYDRFAKATGCPLPPDPGWGRERYPVVGVSWEEAREYAVWLTQQTGRRYRLPSEAEWEYAARAGTTTPFWWGMEPGINRAACFDCGSPWDNRSTAPIMTFAANPFGLYEMHGNAMEWVADCYQSNYQGAPSDGSPLLISDCTRRVARGGAFNKPAASMRSFARAAYSPDTRLKMLGFRVACDP